MSETVPQEQNLNLHDTNNEEFDHRVKKQIRQIEGEYMIEKAVLEQKIDILEAKLREFEERETALKKMNSEIMLTLTDLNRKEDSSLMNKVYEELALANKEKLRERKQHQARFQALKTQAEMNISELKGKLDVKDKERDEMKAMWEEERERYETELEQERKMNEGLKKELEEKRYEAKGGEEFERMKKRVGVLEEENGRLKEEFENEIGRLKEEFERSLSDLKEIHNEERNSYEGRLKKAKEMLARSEGENESKNGVESQLVEEIEMLRKMIGEMEAKSAVEMKRVVSERDAALGRIKELEQGYDCDKEQKTHYSNTEMFVQNLEERLKTLEEREQKDAGLYRTPNVKNTSKNTLFEQPSTEHLIPAFTNFESQIPSLANSIIHEPYYIDQKRPSVIIAPQSQVLVSDPNQFWSNDEQIKIVFSKPNTRSNSRHDLSCMGQTQGSTCCHSETENKRSMVRSVCAYSEKPENLRDPQLAGNREMNEWALKDTSQRRGNWADQGNIRRQSRVNREDYGISYVNENPVNQDFSLHTVKEEWGYDSRVQSRRGSGTRLQVNYPERLCVRNEGMLLRRNGSQGLLESTLRPEVITEKLEAWNEGRGSVMKEEENQYESNKMFRKGIQDVMTGLHNIKSRLEKQQENIILAKNENIKAISNRRSFSNARIRPSVAPRETVNTSFHNESMIGHYAPGKVYPTTANVSMHMTDENTVNVSNVSHYGEREVQNRFAVGNYHLNYRTRTPVMMRESTRTHFHERHRNSFV